MKTKSFKASVFLIFLCFTIHSGCAGWILKPRDVTFEDPYAKLGVVKTNPTDQEKAGVLLRLKARPGTQAHFREDNVIYASIKEGRGIQLKFTLDRVEKYRPGDRRDSYGVRAETTLLGEKGSLLEVMEVTDRGEMVKFLEGFHHSRIGNFKIVDWKRTPLFPFAPVKIGDSWTYEEEMTVRIDSFAAHEVDPKPYEIKAASTLEGFAIVKGKRCAVIKTRTEQRKPEHLKIFFKDVLFEIHSQIEETVYLDVQEGKVCGRITKIQSFTRGKNVPLADQGESQSVFYPLG